MRIFVIASHNRLISMANMTKLTSTSETEGMTRNTTGLDTKNISLQKK